MSVEIKATAVINGETCQAELGESLLEVARRNGSHIGFVCDGKGFCSTCECMVLSGAELINPPTRAEHEWVSPKRLNNGYRLACQAKLARPGTIEIVSRAELLKKNFLASFNPPAGQTHLNRTGRFFGNLTGITMQHLELFPRSLVDTFGREGAFRFFFPWQDVNGFVNDTGRVINHELGQKKPTNRTIPKVEVVVEAIPEKEHVIPPAVEKPAKPFDFLPIEDIGPVFNQRLYDGGVYSYAQLATMSPERLAEICSVAPERVIRLQWREQAAQFAAQGL